MGGTITSTCTGCHNTQSSALIHHVTMNSLAASSCTTGNATGPCHAATNHKGNHVTAIQTYGNCSSCHAATVGGSAATVGAPVDQASNVIHDTCYTCHNTDATLKTLAQTVGGTRVIAMPNPSSSSTDGGGSCFACHGEYFDSHVHGTTGGYVSHAVTFNPVVDISSPGGAYNACNNCHNDAGLGLGTTALSTWAAIKTEHAKIAGVTQASACATCHNYATVGNQSGAADTPPVANNSTALGTHTGVTCVTCHVDKSFLLSPGSYHG
ncbi:MAG: hypothetical protein HGA96_03620 [Desulfobulbaceae bacterium]|nr:hypothetical protein [Desulfobulbaceae bacterium]